MHISSVLVVLCGLFACNGAQKVVDRLRDYLHRDPYAVIKEYRIKTNVTDRFAETVVTSSVYNKYETPFQTTFSVVIPDTAYVTGFSMIINGREYKSFVDELENVRQKYTSQSAEGAGHVGISTRDSNEIDIVVNLEPKTTTIFKLNYEELLERRKSKYSIVSNIFPRQLVELIDVEVIIRDFDRLRIMEEPFLRTGNGPLNTRTPILSEAIIRSTDNWAFIKFTPSLVKQFKLACNGLSDSDSLAAQLVVEYDVERSDPNQVIGDDKYFISFFAPPPKTQPLNKHMLFVLDTSWSMGSESRLQHLKTAMHLILPMLQPNDVFHLISFDRQISVWDINTKNAQNFSYVADEYSYGLSPDLSRSKLPEAIFGTADNIQKAIDTVDVFVNDQNTNIVGALTVAMELVQRTNSRQPNKFQPIVVFLTDGEPIGAMNDTERICSIYQSLNTLSVPTYTISLGQGANRTFLHQLAHQNGGYEKHIYDGVDADMQLHSFYDDISVPLLKQVSYDKLEGITDMTQSRQALVFKGREVKVAGRGAIWKITKGLNIHAHDLNGTAIEFKPSVKVPSGKLDKLWAFLTVKQLLEELKLRPLDNNLHARVVNISLTYSLVTDVTSLVVVKPNTMSSVDITNAYSGPRPAEDQNSVCRTIPWPHSTVRTTTSTTTESTSTITNTEDPTTIVPTFIPTQQPISTSTSRSVSTTSSYGRTNSRTTQRPSITQWVPDNQDICAMRPDLNARCLQWTMGFYFNGDRCVRFRGCDIIFQSEQDCNSQCYRGADSCQMDQDPGSCGNWVLYWYYDQKSKDCRQFWYGGCEGNSNRFETREECAKICSKKLPSATVRPQFY